MRMMMRMNTEIFHSKRMEAKEIPVGEQLNKFLEEILGLDAEQKKRSRALQDWAKKKSLCRALSLRLRSNLWEDPSTKILVCGVGTVVLVPDRRSVSDQGSMNCLDPGPCSGKWNMHMWEEGEGLFWCPYPLILVSVSVTIQTAWRQPRERRPLHMYMLLLGNNSTDTPLPL
jgi:hypothetical protein